MTNSFLVEPVTTFVGSSLFHAGCTACIHNKAYTFIVPSQQQATKLHLLLPPPTRGAQRAQQPAAMFPGGSFAGGVRALGSKGRLAFEQFLRPQLGPTARPLQSRWMCSAASGGLSLLHSAGSRLGGGFMLGSGGVLVYTAASNFAQGETEESLTSKIGWVNELEAGAEEMLNPGQMLRTHPVAKVFVEQDHLFETMRGAAQIREFRCFYEKAKRRFHSVVQLGKDVCGFPQTVHGGLTAAIIDETFGGLGICMWRSGALGVRLPAYTARLEVDYKKKIPSGSVILCTTELEKVEGRKVWMRAEVSDGKGTSYASARALFVAPRMPGEGLVQGIKGWLTNLGGNRE